MKYYKIILDNTFIGVVRSGQFVKESDESKKLFYSDEQHGQFVSYKGVLYKDYWMPPVNTEREFTMASIIEITEEEFNILQEAIDNDEPVIIDDDDEDEPVIIPDPEDPDITIEAIRDLKINQMSRICRQTIESGFDIEIRGETKHFSLGTEDQLNLMSLGEMAKTQEVIPYHADGEECTFYTANEINAIITEANTFKNYQLIYFNALKSYINALNTLEDIAAVTYGIDIPDAYKTDVLKVLEY